MEGAGATSDPSSMMMESRRTPSASAGRFDDDDVKKRKLLDPMRRKVVEERIGFLASIRDMEEEEHYGTVTKEMPAPGIVRHHDLLEKLWGWDRLVPFTISIVSWSEYIDYLQAYHSHNAHKLHPPGAPGSSVAALAETKEENLASLWKIWRTRMDIISMSKSIILSCLIHKSAQSVMWTASSRFSDVCSAALFCISKEADLTCELMAHGANPIEDYLIDQSSEIRLCALSLMNCTSCHSVAASTAMLGMAKEAEVMCEWMRENNRCIDFYDDPIPKVILESRKIRIHTLYVMIKITEEFSAAAAGHKIGREEPATTNGPGCNGNNIDTEEAANINGGRIPDVVNSQDHKIKEDDKCRKGNMEGEGLFEKLRVWERLLPPYAFAGRTDYNNYLEKYYNRNALGFVARATANRNPEELLLDSAFGAVQIATTASSDLAASVSISCLKMEEALVSELKPQGRHCLYGVPVDIIIHSRLIKERVLSICGTAGEVSIPSTIAFVCITKEAELMTELLKLGAVLTDEMVEQTSLIRICALGFANLKGHQSIAAAAAAVVGMAKETGIMLDWIKRENKLPRFSLSEPHELEEARLIRIRTMDVMMSMLQESFFPS